MPFVRLEGPPTTMAPKSRFVVLEKSKDPRASADYKRERSKADAIIKPKAPRSAFEALANSPPIPVLDEMIGGATALGNEAVNVVRRARNEPTVDSRSIYLANKDAVNSQQARTREKYPVATTVGGLLAGFSAAPVKGASVVAPVASAAKSPSGKLLDFLANSAKATASGGLFGGAYGLAEGEGAERLHNAGEGAKYGAGAGFALHGAGSLVSSVAPKAVGAVKDVARAVTRKPTPPGQRPVATPQQVEAAAEAAERLASRQGLTPDKVRALAADRFKGKPATAAEIMGREGVGQLAVTARRGGSTADELEGLLVQRQRSAPERVMADFSDDLGVSPEAARGDIDSMVERGRAEAKPLYDAAMGGDAPVWNDELAALTERPAVQRAVKSAQESALNAGREPMRLGKNDDGRPTAQTWDQVKKVVDSLVERDPVTNRVIMTGEVGIRNRDLQTVASDLRRALAGDGKQAGAIPGYDKALAKSGDYLQIQSAFERAKGKLSTGTVGDFGKLIASAKTPAEKNAIRAAVGSDVLDLANRGQLKGGKFSVPGIQQKLELAFGRQGAERFLSKMDAEASLAKTGGRMMPGAGSPTDELGAAAAELGRASDGARIAGKFARGQPVSATLDALGTGVRAMIDYSRTAGLPVEVRDEFGRLLQMSADEFADWLGSRAATPKAQVRGYMPAGIAAGELTGSALMLGETQ